jgi:hypothetical protein
MKILASVAHISQRWNHLNDKQKNLFRFGFICLIYLVPVLIIATEFVLFRNLQQSIWAPDTDQTNLQIQRIYLNAVWVLGFTSLLVWIALKLLKIRGRILSMPWILMISLLFLLFTQLMDWFVWN